MLKSYPGDENRSIHVALIATYPEMAKLLLALAEEEGVKVDNYYASFGEAVSIAKKIEKEVDAILTRGGTGHDIKQIASIPVVMIPITPFDLCESIHRLPKGVKEVAFINFDRKIYGVRSIETIFDIRIHELTFRNKNDIERGVREVKAQGIKTIIGGDVAVGYARSEGLTGIEVTSGKEAVYRALQETITLIRSRRLEQKKAQRLQVAFNSISEGIVIADERKRISLCNAAARSLFGVRNELPADRMVGSLIPDNKIDQVFETLIPVQNHLLNIKDVVVNVNHVPIELEDKFIGVVSTIEDVTKIQSLEGQIRNKLSEKGFFARYTFHDIVTCNPAMMNLKKTAALYADTKSTVLIEGESGTGKELFAQSIHNASNRSKAPFVAVNCAAIPEQLLESELFGYEGGAFTGARKEGKQGLFEMANNGTIFLDEIGEVPKALQARLLRTLQEKEIMRIGGNKMIPVNVRIIGATNKNLKEKVKREEFREDLYFRLNVFNIKIPPLRERKEDIPLLCSKFIESWELPLNEEERQTLNEKVLPVLVRYEWPGNIRELHNIVERLAFFLQGKTDIGQWREMVKELDSPERSGEENSMPALVDLEDDLKTAVAKIEREIIERMLSRHNKDQDVVAEKLGIGKTTLWRKLNMRD